LAAEQGLVVLDDANVDEAVKAAVFGSFLYQGQICMSTERIVVDESIADEFVATTLLSGSATGVDKTGERFG
jgi:salicylaldehyde dehydrogenase